MTSRYQNVKRYKLGAHWPDGKARMCIRCQSEVRAGNRKRRNQAVVVANSVRDSIKLPVAWCEDHIPEGIDK